MLKVPDFPRCPFCGIQTLLYAYVCVRIRCQFPIETYNKKLQITKVNEIYRRANLR